MRVLRYPKRASCGSGCQFRTIVIDDLQAMHEADGFSVSTAPGRVPVVYEGRGFLQPALAVNGPQGWPDGSDQSQLARSFGSNVQRFGRAMSLALTLSMVRYRTLRALPLRLARSFCGLQRESRLTDLELLRTRPDRHSDQPPFPGSCPGPRRGLAPAGDRCGPVPSDRYRRHWEAPERRTNSCFASTASRLMMT